MTTITAPALIASSCPRCGPVRPAAGEVVIVSQPDGRGRFWFACPLCHATRVDDIGAAEAERLRAGGTTTIAGLADLEAADRIARRVGGLDTVDEL